MKELNINLNHDYIPINLVEPDTGVKHEFRYNYDDTTLNSYRDDVNPMLEKFKAAEETNTFEEIDDMLKEAFEFLLGPGSYEKIKTIQKSIINRQNLIFSLIKLIEEELTDFKIEAEEEEADKYAID